MTRISNVFFPKNAEAPVAQWMPVARKRPAILLLKWLNQCKDTVCKETVWKLVALFPNFGQCHCLRCARLFNRRKKCEHCLGLHTNKGHDPNCLLQTGCLRVRKSYPKYWPYYLKLLAHGISHERAECCEHTTPATPSVRVSGGPPYVLKLLIGRCTPVTRSFFPLADVAANPSSESLETLPPKKYTSQMRLINMVF